MTISANPLSSAPISADRLAYVSTGISGTVATTNANDTLAASGAFTPPAITGTLARSNANDTLAASGTVAAPAGITGTVNATNNNDPLQASGTNGSASNTSAGGGRTMALRKGYIFKGRKYWLTEQELAEMIREELAQISRKDVKTVKRGKQKQLPREVWDAIMAKLSKVDEQMQEPNSLPQGLRIEPFDPIAEDDEDAIAAILMAL